jgi:hypothetical protein
MPFFEELFPLPGYSSNVKFPVMLSGLFALATNSHSRCSMVGITPALLWHHFLNHTGILHRKKGKYEKK